MSGSDKSKKEDKQYRPTRWSIARKVTSVMRESWSCQTVQSSLNDRVMVADWPVAHTIFPQDKLAYLRAVHEATETGVEFYPHVYGVFFCPNGSRDMLYAYHEPETGGSQEERDKASDLVSWITRPSDWNDLVYQVMTIVDYEEESVAWRPTGPLEGLYCQRIAEPKRVDYVIQGEEETELRMYHKFLILRWPSVVVNGSDNDPAHKKENWKVMAARELLEIIQKASISGTKRVYSFLQEIIDGTNLSDALLHHYLRKQDSD